MLVASTLIGMCPKPQRRLLLLLPFLFGTFFRFSLLLLNSLFFSFLCFHLKNGFQADMWKSERDGCCCFQECAPRMFLKEPLLNPLGVIVPDYLS